MLEGVVNALIHRNYLEIGSEVHIDMFDDRIEIYSPGGMVSGISLEGKNLLKIPSKRRNPILADIFSRLKYMERRGNGFKKILADYEGQGVQILFIYKIRLINHIDAFEGKLLCCKRCNWCVSII